MSFFVYSGCQTRIMRHFVPIWIVLLLAGCGHGENRRAEEVVSEAAGLLYGSPDSALRLIERIDPGKISRRSTRARYALVYSAALDKNYVDVDRDSLISIAWRYYENRRCPDSLRAVLFYYRGRVCQNAGEFPRAIPCYLSAREHADRAGNQYLAALVCCRLGEIHSAQMNFGRMFESYREAYDLWGKLGRKQDQNPAQYGQRPVEPERQRPGRKGLFRVTQHSPALDTASACLCNLASIYLSRGGRAGWAGNPSDRKPCPR